MQRGGVAQAHQTHSPSTESAVRRKFSAGFHRKRACGAASDLRHFRYSFILSITFSVLCVHCMRQHTLRRELLLLSVMPSCLSLSEHLTSLSREKLKKVCQCTTVGLPCPLPSQLLSCSVIFPVHCTVSSLALFLKSIFFSWQEGQVKRSIIRFVWPTIAASRAR